MARVTVEDCLEKVDNRFSLVHLSAKRVRQLRKGEDPLVLSKNSDIVVSLREIAAGKVFPTDSEEMGQMAELAEYAAVEQKETEIKVSPEEPDKQIPEEAHQEEQKPAVDEK